jgi:CDP-glucose 4,6-dehydratase
MEIMAVNPAFWQKKRVFITGHTGFKGSWLSLWLQSLGVDLTGFAMAAPTKPSLFEEAGVAAGMRSIVGDIRELATLQKSIVEAQPEILIHLAAQPLVRYSYQNPVETYATNVMGTVHVLEAVRNAPSVKAVVVVTTDKCYENREWEWGYRENEPMGGHDPYSNSKGCAELVTSAYRRSFLQRQGVAVASARAGNVIGGGDWAADRLIPDILRAFAQKQPALIRNPNAIRPWQHVLEPLRGYLTLAEKLFTYGLAFEEGWNFGPNEEDAKTVAWVADQMVSMWGTGAGVAVDNHAHPHEANYLKLDISKARGRLNWHPALRLPRALELTTQWYKAHATGSDVRAITQTQIEDYQTLTKVD